MDQYAETLSVVNSSYEVLAQLASVNLFSVQLVVIIDTLKMDLVFLKTPDQTHITQICYLNKPHWVSLRSHIQHIYVDASVFIEVFILPQETAF